MKTNSTDTIKMLRREMGLSQEDLAEKLFISVRQLARIESGEVGMDVWQFITTMELLGAPTEDFWLLYLDSGEYESYREYKRLKRQLMKGEWSEASNIISNIEKSSLIKQPVVKQFAVHLKAIAGMTTPSVEVMDDLHNAMIISKPNFEEDKISEYRMTYNEISIALHMAQCLSALKEHDRAIAMIQSMIDNRERAHVSEEDKASIFPSLYLVFSYTLINAGKYKEALKACENAIETSREHNNLIRIPEMLFCLADCYYKLGEEEHIYKTHLVRAYHVAYAIGRNKDAATIKEDALKYCGVVIP